MHTTETTVAGPNLAPTSLEPIEAALSTVVRHFSSVQTSVRTEEATSGASDRSSQHASTTLASTLTPVGGAVRPYSSTPAEAEGTSAATTENDKQFSEAYEFSPPVFASPATKTTTKVSNSDSKTATATLASSPPLNGQNAWSTTGSEGNGGHGSTTLNSMIKSTTTNPGQGAGSTTGKGVDSASASGDADDRKAGTTTPLAPSGILKGSTLSTITAATPPKHDRSCSITANTDGIDTAITKDSNLALPTFVTKQTSQSQKPTPSSPLSTNSMLRDSQRDMSTPTTTEYSYGGRVSTSRSGAESNSRQSTARRTNDMGQPATTAIVRKGSGGDSKIGSSRSAVTSNAGADTSTAVTHASEDRSNSDYATRALAVVGDELTTTIYDDYLKNINLNLSFDFDLGDLNEEEKKNLEDISSAYGLDVSFISAFVALLEDKAICEQTVTLKTCF